MYCIGSFDNHMHAWCSICLTSACSRTFRDTEHCAPEFNCVASPAGLKQLNTSWSLGASCTLQDAAFWARSLLRLLRQPCLSQLPTVQLWHLQVILWPQASFFKPALSVDGHSFTALDSCTVPGQLNQIHGQAGQCLKRLQ